MEVEGGVNGTGEASIEGPGLAGFGTSRIEVAKSTTLKASSRPYFLNVLKNCLS